MTDKDYTGKDKVLHAVICLIASIYSTEAAACAAIAKEYGDKANENNHWCWWDICADSIGIAIGTIIRLLIIRRWNWF